MPVRFRLGAIPFSKKSLLLLHRLGISYRQLGRLAEGFEVPFSLVLILVHTRDFQASKLRRLFNQLKPYFAQFLKNLELLIRKSSEKSTLAKITMVRINSHPFS